MYIKEEGRLWNGRLVSSIEETDPSGGLFLASCFRIVKINETTSPTHLYKAEEVNLPSFPSS